MLLLDDSHVALNDVLAACATSADVHEWVAHHADRPWLREFGERGGVRRRHDIDALCRQMQDADRLPKLPDPEAAGVHAALTGLKALAVSALTDEHREAILRALDDAEQALGECVAEARGFEQPAGIAACLDELARDVAARRAELAGG